MAKVHRVTFRAVALPLSRSWLCALASARRPGGPRRPRAEAAGADVPGRRRSPHRRAVGHGGRDAGAGLRRRRVPAPGQHRRDRAHPDARGGRALPEGSGARQAGAPGRPAAGQPRVRRALGRRGAGSVRRARVPQAGAGEAAGAARLLPDGLPREPPLRSDRARDAHLLGRDRAQRPRRVRRVARQGGRRRDDGVGDGAALPRRADPVRAVPRPPLRRSLQAGGLLRPGRLLRAHQDQAGARRRGDGASATAPATTRHRRRRHATT